MESTDIPLQNPSPAVTIPGWGSISTDQLNSPSVDVTTDPVFSCSSHIPHIVPIFTCSSHIHNQGLRPFNQMAVQGEGSHEILEQRTQEKREIKFYLNCKIRFVREVSKTEREYCDAFFLSKNETCLLKESLVEKVKTGFVKIQTSCEEFQTRGSGWVIAAILYFEVNTCTYHPLAASSFIPLPSAIEKKGAIVNIKNTDKKMLPLVRVSRPSSHYNKPTTSVQLSPICEDP
ncbi:hypothetical protein AVEN_216646-1 [Araneus ventricosus]|uniref:Uncharacterized protein n=1 Tax=Araneus ventricosus TaxID=182803 RepID=A0A4Y2DX48_ARAVE|nr:hypothetical protein AVEN_216646-1 [Araneus ventricosus]